MSTAKITFSAWSTSRDLLFTAALDDQVFYHGTLGDQPQIITCELDDDEERDRSLTLTMAGKTAQHTKVDADGNIVEDVVISLADFAFDDIRLGHVMTEKSRYRHDFNGTQSLQDDQFFGSMGCNGTVRLDFYSPIYLWLLENI